MSLSLVTTLFYKALHVKGRDLILITLRATDQLPEFKTINWRDAARIDSDDDYRTGCRNVSHCLQQQSYSGRRSPRRSYSTYLGLS